MFPSACTLTDSYWNDVGSLPEYVQGNFDVLAGEVDAEPAGKVFDADAGGADALGRGVELEGRVLVGEGATFAEDAQLHGPLIVGPGASSAPARACASRCCSRAPRFPPARCSPARSPGARAPGHDRSPPSRSSPRLVGQSRPGLRRPRGGARPPARARGQPKPASSRSLAGDDLPSRPLQPLRARIRGPSQRRRSAFRGPFGDSARAAASAPAPPRSSPA